MEGQNINYKVGKNGEVVITHQTVANLYEWLLDNPEATGKHIVDFLSRIVNNNS